MKKTEARALQAILRRAIADIVKVREKVDADSREHDEISAEEHGGESRYDGYCVTASFMTDCLQLAESNAEDALEYFDGFPDSWYDQDYFNIDKPCVRYHSEKPKGWVEYKAVQKELADEISELKNKTWAKEADLRILNDKLKMLDKEWKFH
jgi:hypothetical protein